MPILYHVTSDLSNSEMFSWVMTFVIQRFLPSEFGYDADRAHGCVDPIKSLFDTKAHIRRTIEAEGIPYTYVLCNCFAGYLLPTFGQPGATSPPTDEVLIFGDGNVKGNKPFL